MNRLVKKHTGQVVLEGVSLGSTFYGRLTGYLFKSSHDIPGILFLHTSRVHTMGMRFSLDLYFFDPFMRVLGFSRNVKPMRAPGSPEKTHHILEVPHRPGSPPLDLTRGDLVSIIKGEGP